jgi:hypothetical protein
MGSSAPRQDIEAPRRVVINLLLQKARDASREEGNVWERPTLPSRDLRSLKNGATLLSRVWRASPVLRGHRSKSCMKSVAQIGQFHRPQAGVAFRTFNQIAPEALLGSQAALAQRTRVCRGTSPAACILLITSVLASGGKGAVAHRELPL